MEKDKESEIGNGKNVSEEAGKLEMEHYSQNKPNEFSSENFKIELRGLPNYYPHSQLKKLLKHTLQLEYHRVKQGGSNRNVAYVNFKDEASRSKAITILNGYEFMRNKLSAKEADPTKDPVLLKKMDFLKVPKKDCQMLSLKDRLQKAVTPYHDMPYKDQIKEKDNVVKSFLKKLGHELAKLNPDLRNFVHFQKSRWKGQICEVDDFAESPVRQAYRNKCEFTIGKNKESDKPVVGFRVASYKEGSVEVGQVDHLTHLNDKMKEVVKYMESYLESSGHATFNPFTHDGVWRQLTVRTSQNSDVMLIVQIHPQNLSEEELNDIKDDLKKYFIEGGRGAAVGVTSIYFQQVGQRVAGKEVEYEHVYGKTYIEETILGKTFRASPDAFLQVNTPACEVLYKKIAEVADIDSTTIVLDVCCGVGTIGLSVAENSCKTMGVEYVDSAVENARKNAEINEIENAFFYNGKAEDYIQSMIDKSQSNVVAIVDPPRAGLGGGVMNALRKCERLNKIVYISCDPQAALPNFQALGRPRSKNYKGSYFVPIRAAPVDLFPDTPHYELIIVFERYNESKWDKIMDECSYDQKQDCKEKLKNDTDQLMEEQERRAVKRPAEEWKEEEEERSAVKKPTVVESEEVKETAILGMVATKESSK